MFVFCYQNLSLTLKIRFYNDKCRMGERLKLVVPLNVNTQDKIHENTQIHNHAPLNANNTPSTTTASTTQNNIIKDIK